MEPFVGDVEHFGLCGRPTVRRRVFWKRAPCCGSARGKGQESDWQSEPLFLEEVDISVNFFQKNGVTLPVTFGPFLSWVRREVSVSRKHDDEQLGGHIARKVRLRLKKAP